LRGFNIRDGEGALLKGKVNRIEGHVPEEGIEIDRLMDVFFTYHLEYQLKARPEFLSFSQSFGAGYVMLPAVMELMVYQKSHEPEPAVMLGSGDSPVIFEFGWNDRYPTPGIRPESSKQRYKILRKKRMGIKSYSQLYSFVYINDHEVRLELLIPLATLETWIQVRRQNKDYLEIEEQEAAFNPLAVFFQNKNNVSIDGIDVKPTVQRLDFYGLDFRDFAVRAEKKRLSAPTARVGVILSYSTKGPPEKIRIKWELLNSYVYKAKSVIIAYEETHLHNFNTYNTHWEWINPGGTGMAQVSGIPAGSGSNFSDSDIQSITRALLKNVYRAFDWHHEKDIYEALEKSIHGELLSEVYLDIRRSLILQEQGGAVSRVKKVEIQECVPTETDRQAFRAEMDWTVEGTVEHWGHIHTRINRYKAEFSVNAIAGKWKITKMTINEHKRLKYFVNLRPF
jgi:hypothetical protein